VSSIAERCAVDNEARAAECARLLQSLADQGIDRVRIGWCDLHGALRGKTLMLSALADALDSGVGMVSTLMLKDTSDRTAYKVFEPGLAERLPGFGMANNLLLLPDPASLTLLPWAPHTGWLRAQPWFDDGTPVPLDARRVLQLALARLADAGYALRCGLEVEFHVYRIESEPLDPMQAAWPGEPPAVSMLHPGYNLLCEAWADRADAVLRIAQHTAQGLGLPLRSLEIELGPSQFEAVFDATDALTAADHMVLFRNGVAQALRRAGYLATFMCRPPFANIMSSGWHLHQSLVQAGSGLNLFMRAAANTGAAGASPRDASTVLSDLGAHWLAGLLAHARGGSAFSTPTVNGYGRFGVNALAPQAVLWGRDNRGAMLRVLGGLADAATRIENRIGEPMANPYLYIAAQVHAGLDGMQRELVPPPATDAPYAAQGTLLPTSLAEALDALQQDDALCRAFGAAFVEHYLQVKRHEVQRHETALDKDAWQRREYFSRF
jgi:glutamine synthetase